VLSVLERSRRTAWIVAERAQVRGFDGEVLALGFATQGDIDAFKPQSEHLRAAIQEVLGVRVKFTAKAEGSATGAVPTVAARAVAEPAPEPSPRPEPEPAPEPAPRSEPEADPEPEPDSPPAEWSVAPIPADEPAPVDERASADAPGPRYGEAVVREMLGARFLEEHPIDDGPR